MPNETVALLNAAITEHSLNRTHRNFRRDIDATIENFEVVNGETPETYDYAGVVVTGSAASVYWDDQWIEDLKQWVDEAIRRNLPVLGVCFGHQLVADVLGGEVVDRGDYEIGYKEINQTADSDLLDGVPNNFIAFETHSDEVANLPTDAEMVARNRCSIQAFVAGNAAGVQFHPEYDMETAKSVTRGKDELSEERKSQVISGITEENYHKATDAKAVLDNFLEK